MKFGGVEHECGGERSPLIERKAPLSQKSVPKVKQQNPYRVHRAESDESPHRFSTTSLL